MSLFDGIESANVQRDSEFIRPGRYFFRVDSIRSGRTRKGIDFVAFNFTCVHVVDDTAAADEPKGPHRVADRVSWMVMKDWDSFLTTVKSTVKALTGCTEDEVTVEAVNAIIGDGQPLAGMYCEVDATTKITRNNGKFTRVAVKRAVEQSELLTVVPSHVAATFKLK